LIQNESDEDTVSASDYSIMVKNIPTGKEIDYEEELKKIFKDATEKARSGQEVLEVKKITLVYDIEELEEKEHEINGLIKKKQKYLRDNQYETNNPNAITDQAVIEIDREIKHLHHEV